MVVLACVTAARPAPAQVRVDAGTQVKSIRFRGAKSVPEAQLREILQTRDRGSYFSVRSGLAVLPFIGPPTPRLFTAIELQRDVVRLRQRYRDAGFLAAQVHYEVQADEPKNLLRIVFVIDEGRPVHVAKVTVTGPDSMTSPPVPHGQEHSWRNVQKTVLDLRGHRLEVAEVRQDQKRLRTWWLDRGFPAADTRVAVDVDSVRGEAHVRHIVAPGAPARFGPVTIGDSASLAEPVIRRELPFQEGDPYSAAALDEGRTELQELEIVRSASFELPPPTAEPVAPDGEGPAVPVRVNLFEAKRRMIGGDVGYGSDLGFTTEARWSHRNFTGSARTLTFSALAQTGWLALVQDPDKRYRASVSFLQPYLFYRRFAGVLSPFLEKRDDIYDRSLEYGTNATFIYRASAFRSASLDYRISRRQVYEYQIENFTDGSVDLLTLLSLAAKGVLDSLGTVLENSTFTLTARLGALDQPTDARKGVLFTPAIQVTAPPALSTTQYWKLDGTLQGYLPIRRHGRITARISAGNLRPFGKSLPSPGEDPAVNFLQLRDVLLTAGGSDDVRGWGWRLLGPKFPDIRFVDTGDTTELQADGYVPVGGLARTTFSVELRMPLAALGKNVGAHTFLDGGRVWTSDSRFNADGDPYGDEKWFYATGAGLDVHTPVGPIRLSLGYKLNPSVTDLADSKDILDASLSGRPLDDLPRHQSRRWQLHLSFGTGF
jgi:outer membrane protein insertion porin family